MPAFLSRSISMFTSVTRSAKAQGPAVIVEELAPSMRGQRRWVCPLLDAHQLDIGAVRKTGQRHLRYMLRVGTAVFRRYPGCGSEGLTHRIEVRAGNGHMIECEIGRKNGEWL
jgi:hypothetical protein